MTDRTAPNLRVLRIFEVIAAAGRPLTPTEINAELGWPKQSLHRLCQTLVVEGYLIKQMRRLYPAKRLLDLSAGLAQQAAGDTTRHQILINVARETGETVNFVRPETKGMIYADRVETDWPFRILLPVGTHVPFHCTASGKTYLASLPAARRRTLLASLDLRPYTAATHTRVDSLEDELKRIGKHGYAMDLEEFHSGMVAIAVPVLDDKKRYLAALAVHGPKQRFSVDDAIGQLDLLKESAQMISQTLQY
jgi:DNA-binding IclR family transcriptional regulator